MKNKKELIEEVNKLAQEHAFKKSVIEKMLNDLDQKKEFTEAHSEGMSVIEDIMREMDEIWSKSEELKKQIRGN
jgi:methyl-accepting chemotaxis protein